MKALSKTLFLLLVACALCLANIPINLTMTDPNFGKPNDNVFGDPMEYAIQSFDLQGPAGGGVVGTWTLTIQTNYGDPNPSDPGYVNPVGVSSMPDFCDGGGSAFSAGSTPCADHSNPFFMSDFLIQQGSTYYGIVMSTHHIDYGTPGYSDSYVAGNLYSASGFQGQQHGNPVPNAWVILDPGGTQLNSGSGTLSVALNTSPGGGTCYGQPHGTGANATDCAFYKVTDTFTVSSASNFFNPNVPLTIYASSADCFNATLVVTTPEPSGLIWLLPALFLLGAYLRRRSLAEVK
ncbi:MAG TPA: hypothetical protein VG096_04325 [Bryobacteraceae bacterium]|nr:hypothetical protein [Bryobacteraceae bacterium]